MAPGDRPAPMRHDWRIDAREHERHVQRRGRRNAYDALDARRTALVVVDMVEFFADSPYVVGIVGDVDRLARVLRDANGTIAWVVPAVAAPTSWAVEFYGADVAARYARSGGSGAPQDRVMRELATADGDLWVEKSSASALFPGRSTLDRELAARGIDTVLIAGTVTSVCCESTARDAATLGYRVVVLGDATADVGDGPHNAALRTIHRSFGDVRSTDEVIGMIERGDRAR